MYTSKTPQLLKALAKDLVWNMPRTEHKVYLTFDDGPTPGVTDKALDLLSEFKAKATFFCVGRMVEDSGELLHRIKSEGHSLGNHTMNHESGWNTSNFSYFRSALSCAELVKSNLFRPPYGRITKSQAKALKSRNQIIMWDVLPGDFDEFCTAEKAVERIKTNAQNGSIIVLHDSQKHGEKMLAILPEALKWLKSEGYEMCAIEEKSR